MSPRPRKSGRRQSRGGQGQQQRRRGQQRTRDRGVAFWGDPEALPAPRQDVRITEDPSAVVRSLGPPPLPGHEVIAEHYFRAVYDRAVMLSGALAAAGGLIEPEELQEELGG
jgi:hypothetical protein